MPLPAHLDPGTRPVDHHDGGADHHVDDNDNDNDHDHHHDHDDDGEARTASDDHVGGR